MYHIELINGKCITFPHEKITLFDANGSEYIISLDDGEVYRFPKSNVLVMYITNRHK